MASTRIELLECKFGPGTLGLTLEVVEGVGIRIAEDGISPTASAEAHRTLRAGDLLIRIAEVRLDPMLPLAAGVDLILAAKRPMVLAFQREVRRERASAAAASSSAATKTSPPAKRRRVADADAETKVEPSSPPPPPPPPPVPACVDGNEAASLLLLTNLGFGGALALQHLRAAGGDAGLASGTLRQLAIEAIERQQLRAAQMLSEGEAGRERERRRREREMRLMAGDIAGVFEHSVVLKHCATVRALLRTTSVATEEVDEGGGGGGGGGGGSLRSIDLEVRSALLQLFEIEQKVLRWYTYAASQWAIWLAREIDAAALPLPGDGDGDGDDVQRRCRDVIDSNRKLLNDAVFSMPEAGTGWRPPALLLAHCPRTVASAITDLTDGCVEVGGSDRIAADSEVTAATGSSSSSSSSSAAAAAAAGSSASVPAPAPREIIDLT